MTRIDKKSGIITSDNDYQIKLDSRLIHIITNDGLKFTLGFELVESGKKFIIFEDHSLSRKLPNFDEHFKHVIEALQSIGLNVVVS